MNEFWKKKKLRNFRTIVLISTLSDPAAGI
jgi:hypothetical protein